MSTKKRSTEAGAEQGTARPDAEAESAPPPDSPQKRTTVLDVIRSRQFLLSFFGWYAVNGALWLLAPDPGLVCAAFPLNLMLLLGFGLKKGSRLVALGLLTAIATNAAVSLILQMTYNATCFIPFFVQGQDFQL